MCFVNMAYSTSRGLLKLNQEDNLYCNGVILERPADSQQGQFMSRWRGSVCAGVFDGLGGMPEGEKASFTAAYTLRQKMDGPLWSVRATESRMKKLLHELNNAVYACSLELGYQVGTTAAVLVLNAGTAVVGNVGDSRVYRLLNGKLEQLSVDHSDRKLLKELGVEGRSPSLMQYVGMEKEKSFFPSVVKITHKGEGRFLLCSDGLTDMVDDAEIEDICVKSVSSLDCANRLIERAVQYGGKDNITVIVCDLYRKKPVLYKNGDEYR